MGVLGGRPLSVVTRDHRSIPARGIQNIAEFAAMPFMMTRAKARGVQRVGLLLTNTAWGRSNLAAVQKYEAASGHPKVVGTAWYNWQEKSLVEPYLRLVRLGAQAILLVANDDEAATLVREMARLEPAQRVPVLSHCCLLYTSPSPRDS